MRKIDKEFLDKMTKASNIIALKSRRSGSSWMVASAALTSVFDDIFKKEQIRKQRETKINNLLKMSDKQLRYDITYLEMARTWSNYHIVIEKSRALIVKNGMIISDGTMEHHLVMIIVVRMIIGKHIVILFTQKQMLY